MTTALVISTSPKRKVRIYNTKHAESIARTDINDDAYLMMAPERMKDIIAAVSPWLKTRTLIDGLDKMKEVVEYDTSTSLSVR